MRSMKSCPTCSRTYSDDTLTFCLNDGNLLSAPYQHQAIQTVPASDITNPPPTEVLPSALKTAESTRQSPQYQTIPAFQSSAFNPDIGKQQSQKKGNNKGWLAIGILVFLMMVIGTVLIVGRSIWLSKNNSTVKSSASNSNASNNNSMPTSTASTPQERVGIDITGTWKGKFQDSPATLIINNQNDNSYSGTLNNSGALVGVGGTINESTRQITLEEREVIRTQKGRTWTLGSGKGVVSEDGKRMSGKSRDKRNGAYSWTLSKS